MILEHDKIILSLRENDSETYNISLDSFLICFSENCAMISLLILPHLTYLDTRRGYIREQFSHLSTYIPFVLFFQYSLLNSAFPQVYTCVCSLNKIEDILFMYHARKPSIFIGIFPESFVIYSVSIHQEVLPRVSLAFSKIFVLSYRHILSHLQRPGNKLILLLDHDPVMMVPLSHEKRTHMIRE